MHTTELPSGRLIHHNGDFTGDVLITISGDELTHDAGLVRLPWDDVRAMVLAKLRDEREQLREDVENI